MNEKEQDRQLIPAEEFVKADILLRDPRFGKERLSSKIAISAAQGLIRLFQKILGGEIYLVPSNQELFLYPVSPQMYGVAKLLQDENIIARMERVKQPVDWPQDLWFFYPVSDSGKKFKTRGFTGGSYFFNAEQAFRSALAETLERYSLCVFYENKIIIRGSYKQLKKRGAVDPSRFRYLSKNQLAKNKELAKQYVDFDENTQFSWLEARSLIDGKPALVPAQLACFGFKRPASEPYLRETNTNGAGAGDTWERAVYAGICEAVERDALLIHYLNRLSPPEIDKSTIPDNEIQTILDKCRRYGIEIHLFDVTTDIGVPTILCLVLDRSGKNIAVRVSGKADFDVTQAIYGALKEGLIRHSSSLPLEQALKPVSPQDLDVISRVYYWGDPNMLSEIDFWLKGKLKPMPENNFVNKDFRTKLEALKAVFEKHKLDSYVVDVTSPIARKVGLYVAMTLTPDLCPLYLYEKNKYLGARRLYEVPVRMGYFAEPKKEEDLNQIPHPIP